MVSGSNFSTPITLKRTPTYSLLAASWHWMTSSSGGGRRNAPFPEQDARRQIVTAQRRHFRKSINVSPVGWPDPLCRIGRRLTHDQSSVYFHRGDMSLPGFHLLPTIQGPSISNGRRYKNTERAANPTQTTPFSG